MAAAPSRERLGRLLECLLSPAVQVPAPTDAKDEPPRLSAKEVEKVFVKHVPGVRKFLFRQKPGLPSLKFLQGAYKDGLQAFVGTVLHEHLTRLMRVVVHYGHDGRPGAARYLMDVAEAFMDCQAVQARAIERAGRQILGMASDFRGLAAVLVGEYKTLALRMLAAERLAQGLACDYDSVPTHYENRLTADLGHRVGLNADDVRRAELDQHAHGRFACLDGHDAEAAAARLRELFDVDALLHAFVAELNSFGDESSPESLPRLFLGWATTHLTQSHAVLDEQTCTRVEVDSALALTILEVLFLGRPFAPAHETFRGVPLCEFFRLPVEDVQEQQRSPPAGCRGKAAAAWAAPLGRHGSAKAMEGRLASALRRRGLGALAATGWGGLVILLCGLAAWRLRGSLALRALV